MDIYQIEVAPKKNKEKREKKEKGVRRGWMGTFLLPHQMRRVLDAAVGAELRPDVLVAEQPHPRLQVLAVGAQDPPIQCDGWQQRHRRRRPAGAAAGAASHRCG